MKRTARRIVAAAISLAASGVVLLAACGFPSPVLRDDDLDAAASGSGATDAPMATDASMATPSTPDARVSTTVSERIDAAGCTSCDCDNDGYPNRQKPGCADAGPPDAGDDCEDEYPDVHPGQTEFTQEEHPPHGGDRNCDGNVERLYKETNVKCPSFLDLTCEQTKGYTTDPGCGEKSAYVKCKLGLLECKVAESEILYPPQGCR